MSMTAEAAQQALDAAKHDGDFVDRYLAGDREAFTTMQRLMRAAYPDEAPGEGAAGNNGGAGAAKEAPDLPVDDDGGEALPQWLSEAGDAAFAPPRSPAYYRIEYAPHVEIDPEFDRLAREWMYKAELPAGWSSEIARDYQRRAARPPSAAELAEERAAVLGRLRRHWGDETEARLAQVRDLVHGIGDDRLIETLNHSGLGNSEWLIRQLAIFADRRAGQAAERTSVGEQEPADARGEAESATLTPPSHNDLGGGDTLQT
ncbi:MAG TPA: hypothetical protein VF274_00490 [Alphaproteobacteria bacterium]